MGMGHISIVWVADGAGAHISRVLLNMHFSRTARPEHWYMYFSEQTLGMGPRVGRGYGVGASVVDTLSPALPLASLSG